MHQAGHIDSFVKVDPFPCYKSGRMINSRTDKFKVFAGPYFKALEEQLYLDPHYVKHVPVAERWKRVAELNKGYRFYYSTDYTAFESHFTPKRMLNIEGKLYRRAFHNDRYRTRLLQVLTGWNRCRTRTGVRCTIAGRRMSGDMNTSLGNGFSNQMIIEYVMHNKGCKPDSYDYLVEGDDGLIASNVELCAKDFEDCGFTVKIDRVANPCHASFCGIVCPDSGCNLRDPCRFFEKFGWTSSSVTGGDAKMKSLLKAKSLSALYETPHCPLVSVAAYTCLKFCGAAVPCFSTDYYESLLLSEMRRQNFAPDVPDPPMDARLLFEQLYNVSVEEQFQLESRVLQGDFKCLQVLDFHPDLLDYHLKYVGCH